MAGTNYDMAQTFDALNQPATITYPDNEVVMYTTNNQGDVVSAVAGSDTILSAANRKPWHAIENMTLGSGQVTSYGYDYRERVNSIVTSSVQNLTLICANASNVTGVTDNVSRTETVTYEYDHMDRLTKMWIGATPAHRIEAGGNADGSSNR